MKNWLKILLALLALGIVSVGALSAIAPALASPAWATKFVAFGSSSCGKLPDLRGDDVVEGVDGTVEG